MDRLVQRDDEQEIMLSTEVMRHMLLETTDLLEESQTYLDEAERSTAAAAALSTASRHLLESFDMDFQTDDWTMPCEPDGAAWHERGG